MSVNQSIFGIEAPKFSVNNNDILLDYAVVLADAAAHDEIIHQSIITNHRSWIDKGSHWQFKVMINLFKYSDPLTKFNQIYSLINVPGTLWRRRDRDCFKNSAGSIVLFELTEIMPTWIDSANKPDRLILLFESTDYVDISKSTIATLIDDLGTELTDDLGAQTQ